MNFMKRYFFDLLNFLAQLVKSKPRTAIILMVIGIGSMWLVSSKLATSANDEVEYLTTSVEKGTLIKTISGSGVISSGNSTDITTGASGEIESVFVTNGDVVNKGDKIAEIKLDEYSQEQRATAWVAYLDAKESLLTAQKNKATADITMWQAKQDILDAEDDIDHKNNNLIDPNTNEEYTDTQKVIIDKSLERARLAFSEAELKYKNADSEIQLAKAKIASAYKDYQELSPIIIAPSSGVVSNIALIPGAVIENSNQSSNSSNSNSSSTDSGLVISSQKIGQVEDKDGQLQATINLTEIDIVNVKANQKVTLTIDAFSQMQFVGKVLTIDTSGSSNSGVTTYPVTILIDPSTANIYPNMAVNAEIITEIYSDVLLVPSSAVKITTGSMVQIMKDGQPVSVEVEVGESNGTNTIIKSGLSEGDEVITQVISSLNDDDSVKNSNESSVFGGTGASTRGLTGGQGGVPGGMTQMMIR